MYVYKFDCFPVKIHWIHVSKEACTRALLFFLWFDMLQQYPGWVVTWFLLGYTDGCSNKLSGHSDRM